MHPTTSAKESRCGIISWEGKLFQGIQSLDQFSIPILCWTYVPANTVHVIWNSCPDGHMIPLKQSFSMRKFCFTTFCVFPPCDGVNTCVQCACLYKEGLRHTSLQFVQTVGMYSPGLGGVATSSLARRSLVAPVFPPGSEADSAIGRQRVALACVVETKQLLHKLTLWCHLRNNETSTTSLLLRWTWV